MKDKKVIYAGDLLAAVRDDPSIDGANFRKLKQHIEEAQDAGKIGPLKRYLIKENGDIIPLDRVWIDAEKRPPTAEDADKNGNVLVYYWGGPSGVFPWKMVESHTTLISHWMPLPEPPKEEE